MKSVDKKNSIESPKNTSCPQLHTPSDSSDPRTGALSCLEEVHLVSNLLAIHHVSFCVVDLEISLSFYQKLLSVEVDRTRPDLGYEGVWLNAGAQQIHLMRLPSSDPSTGRAAHVGRDRHVAFLVMNLSVIEKRLKRMSINFTRSQSGRLALFCRDPDGNGLEFIQEV